MTGRSVPEWIGATADTPVPNRVRLRVFEKRGGICHRSGRKIRPGERWDMDHVIALCNWNPTPGAPHGNRESNLAPILADKPHKEKTAEDVAEKSMVARKRAKHFLPKKPSRTFQAPPGYVHRWGRRA